MSKFRVGNTAGKKLTAERVLLIRRRYAARETVPCTMEQLAREERVSLNTIRNVIHGVTWQSVAGAIPESQLQYEALQSEALFKEIMPTVEPSGESPALGQDIPQTAQQERVDPVDEYLKRRLK